MCGWCGGSDDEGIDQKGRLKQDEKEGEIRQIKCTDTHEREREKECRSREEEE